MEAAERAVSLYIINICISFFFVVHVVNINVIVLWKTEIGGYLQR